MEKITARTNDKIKYAVRLGESASFRKQNGEFFLEGARLCFDAAKTGVEIKQAFFTASALEKYSAYAESIIATGCICFEISGDVAKKLSDTENPQGIFCICKSKEKTEKLNYSGKYIALENLQDPSNLGAVCRTVEALGLDGLIVSGGCDINNPNACMDGQMGAVIKTYREWLISGDDAWLKRNWEKVKKALEYAWHPENPFKWDTDKDGYATGRMHHTLDRELFGANGWLEGFYLAALKAGAVMAEHLGETDKAQEYMEIFQSGYEKTKNELFNGSYFIQHVDLNDKSIPESFGVTGMYWNDETKEMKYQIGEGCEIDQLCGQWHANILGLGRLFDEDQTKTACESLFKNNFKESMRDFVNPWRIFALNDDAGSVICDYPEGAYKPRIPIPYCEECMHGFEYQLAGLLISEGFVDEGLRCAKAVRDKYNGANRNPFNEIECGNNYARSMASFALIPILSGFVFDMPHGKIGFNPKLDGEFKSVWSLDGTWGSYQKTAGTSMVTVNDGTLSISTLALPYAEKVSEVVIDGKSVDYSLKDGTITFDKTAINEYISIKH